MHKITHNNKQYNIFYSHRNISHAKFCGIELNNAVQHALELQQINFYDFAGYKLNPCKNIIGYTTCEVFDRDNNAYIGYAFCSSQDQFNKKIGRKIALGRALAQVPT